MGDLLVRLYDLPHFEAEEQGEGRRHHRPPRHPARARRRPRLVQPSTSTKLWRGEIALGAVADARAPRCIAVKGQELLGFACYDTSAKGFFGPTGVSERARGQGIGEALLIVTLKAMREAGYAYAVIGDPGPVEFYRKRLDTLEIPNSKPGHYAGMLRKKD